MAETIPFYQDRRYHITGVAGWGNPRVTTTGAFSLVDAGLSLTSDLPIPSVLGGITVAMQYAGTGGFIGDGHVVGLSGSAIMNSDGITVPLMIGTRGTVSNFSGTVTKSAGLHSIFAINDLGAVVTEHAGVDAVVTANLGTMTDFIGMKVRSSGNLGEITSMTGVRVDPPESGTNVNYTAFEALDSTLASGSAIGLHSQIEAGAGTRRNLYCTGDAVNFLAGAVRVGADVDMGALVGSEDALSIKNGVTEPANNANYLRIYVDTADGVLKCKIPAGTTHNFVLTPDVP